MAGSIFLTFAFMLSVLSTVMYYLTFKGAANTKNIARISYHGMAMLVIIASSYFLYIILTHQYQFKYVFSYSNDDLSLGFLISTFWAGQEGSFMLWLLLTALIGVFLQSYTSKRGDLEERTMMVFSLAVTFLLAMVSPLLKNPFAYLWTEPVFIEIVKINSSLVNLPLLKEFMFSDPQTNVSFVKMNSDLFAKLSAAGISVNDFIVHGKGLNPLLQNFWMQIHPPILFIGFSMATVPYSFAIAAMMKNDYSDWVRQSLPWTLAGAGLLGLGIMLGGYWAYGILGWGGYWAWDPVENSSLVPWLVSVAAIHTMLVQRKSQAKGDRLGKFAVTNIILASLVYILVLYSTFLTRSGILGDASVHSFVDPGTIVYLFLVIFISTFILLCGGLLFYRWKDLYKPLESEEGILSRELALFTAAVTLGASAVIVLVGTSAPIFGQSVDIIFYNEMHVPLAIIIGLLNGLSLLMKWKQTKGEEIIKKSYFSLASAFVITLLIVILGGVYDVMMILLSFSAAFTLFVNSEIAYKIFRGNRKMLGAYVAHIGIALFILGVVGSAGYSVEKDIDLKKNEALKLFGYELTFTGYSPIANNTKYAFNVDVVKGDNKYSVQPVMYVSDFNNSLMREPDILNGWTKDFYISPVGFEDGQSAEVNSHVEVFDLLQEKEIHGVKIKYSEFIKPDMEAMMASGNFSMGAKLLVTKENKNFDVAVTLDNNNGNVVYNSAKIDELGIEITIKGIDPASKQAQFDIKDSSHGDISATAKSEILSVTASIKPFINLVWLGVITCVLGFFISVFRRLKESAN